MMVSYWRMGQINKIKTWLSFVIWVKGEINPSFCGCNLILVSHSSVVEFSFQKIPKNNPFNQSVRLYVYLCNTQSHFDLSSLTFQIILIMSLKMTKYYWFCNESEYNNLCLSVVPRVLPSTCPNVQGTRGCQYGNFDSLQLSAATNTNRMLQQKLL